MSHRVISVLFILILGAILVTPLGVGAESISLPVTPDPSKCTAKPMTSDELVAAATSGIAIIVATPPPTADVFVPPQGKPADQKTIDAITQTIIDALSCSNAGKFLAYFTYYGDAAVASFLAGEGITEASLPQVAVVLTIPVPVEPANYQSLVGVREATVLPDGNVGMLVDTISPIESPDVQTSYIVFTEKDDKWTAISLVDNLGAEYAPTS